MDRETPITKALAATQTQDLTTESEAPPPRTRFNSQASIPDIRSPEFQEYLAGWVAGLDNEVAELRKLKVVPKRLTRLENALGKEPDPATGFEGSGIKLALSLLLADRRFYRRLIGTLSTLAIVLESVRVFFHVFGG